MDAVWEETRSSRVTICKCANCPDQFVVTFTDPSAFDAVDTGLDGSYDNTYDDVGVDGGDAYDDSSDGYGV